MIEADRQRGRILGSGRWSGDVAATADRRWLRALIVAAVLPLFGQTFQYVVDVTPLYVLSKGWPLLTAPLALYGMVRVSTPLKGLILVTYLWLLAVSPLISIFQLNNSLGGAVATTIKVWSLTFIFSLSILLTWLNPPRELVTRSLWGLGAATFVIMGLLWVATPDSAYYKSMEETKLFMWDMTRGKRIYMPMFFGILFVFILNRSFWSRPRLWKLVAMAACFVLMLTIYKQRTAIAGTGAIVLLGAALSLGRFRWIALAVLALGAAALAPAFVAYLQSDSLTQSLGGSLSVRQEELAAATRFLNDQPWRWIVGVGSITRGGEFSLAQAVGTDVLFLADLGWLGVVFEYGVVGAVMLLLLHLGGLLVTSQAARAGNVVAGALFDYTAYILLTSAVASVVFAPGELATCMALSLYLSHRSRLDEEAEA